MFNKITYTKLVITNINQGTPTPRSDSLWASPPCSMAPWTPSEGHCLRYWARWQSWTRWSSDGKQQSQQVLWRENQSILPKLLPVSPCRLSCTLFLSWHQFWYNQYKTTGCTKQNETEFLLNISGNKAEKYILTYFLLKFIYFKYKNFFERFQEAEILIPDFQLQNGKCWHWRQYWWNKGT